jgi:hypothetical protein
LNVEVGTVDSVQGQERDFVILSMVRSFDTALNTKDLWFIHEPERLNVATSRSKLALWIICNTKCLEQSHPTEGKTEKDEWCRKLVEYARSIKAIRPVDIPPEVHVDVAGTMQRATASTLAASMDLGDNPLTLGDPRLVNPLVMFADRSCLQPDNLFRVYNTHRNWIVPAPRRVLSKHRVNPHSGIEVYKVLISDSKR